MPSSIMDKIFCGEYKQTIVNQRDKGEIERHIQKERNKYTHKQETNKRKTHTYREERERHTHTQIER